MLNFIVGRALAHEAVGRALARQVGCVLARQSGKGIMP